ncbi:amino acid permease [Streptomyces sp. NPDC007025]|uniref:amino acid permease n=1 Tax=Streptomyces sp. NPDC007025 TaxID=3364771 RepID=UPI0036CCBB7E
MVVLAVAGAAPEAHAGHWTPFTPHGWSGIAGAASPLMLAFVGWEAAAPLTVRLRDPGRQLPRVVAVAFAVTAVLYLAMAGATVAVLGPATDGAVPLADLLRVAIGVRGPQLAAACAIALTLAATNAYLTGAASMAAALVRDPGRGPSTLSGKSRAVRQERHGSVRIVVAIAAVSALLLGLVGAGAVTTAQLVGLPTTLFLAVYLGCMASAARLLTGALRLAAGTAFGVVLLLLTLAGRPVLVALAVVLMAWSRTPRSMPAPV